MCTQFCHFCSHTTAAATTAASKQICGGEGASENARSFHTLLNTIRKEATKNKQMQQQQALLTAGCCSWKKG
jgi:hypothetical protein